MSMFQGISSLGRALALSRSGRSVTFQPLDSLQPTETVTAIVGAVEADLQQGEDTLQKTQLRRIEVPTSTAEGGPTERNRGGKYTIDSEVWTVVLQESVNSQTGMASLLLSRPLRMDSGGRADRVTRAMDR